MSDDDEQKRRAEEVIDQDGSSGSDVEETPTRKGTVKERVEYFQTRQQLAEARRLQEEELFNSRTRSPPTPQQIPPVDERRANDDDAALSPSMHVPTLVHEFEERPSLAKQSETYRLLDPSSWFGRFRQPNNPQSEQQQNDIDDGADDASHEDVDEMVLQAGRTLSTSG
jgi:hypothetical protein